MVPFVKKCAASIHCFPKHRRIEKTRSHRENVPSGGNKRKECNNFSRIIFHSHNRPPPSRALVTLRQLTVTNRQSPSGALSHWLLPVLSPFFSSLDQLNHARNLRLSSLQRIFLFLNNPCVHSEHFLFECNIAQDSLLVLNDLFHLTSISCNNCFNILL